MSKVTEKYLNLQKSMIAGEYKAISMKEFYSDEFINSLKVVDEFKHESGQTIQIVEIPKGIRVDEIKITGGFLAQPWFKKGEVSRIFADAEFIEFSKEGDEEELLFYQMLYHEIGHLVSMSNDFTQEYDTGRMEEDGIDEREIYNLRCWIKKHGLDDKPLCDSTIGETIDKTINGLKGWDIFGTHSAAYIQMREHCAWYYCMEAISKMKQQNIVLEQLEKNVAELGLLVAIGLSSKAKEDLGLDENDFRLLLNNRDEFNDYKKQVDEISKPLFESYRKWFN